MRCRWLEANETCKLDGLKCAGELECPNFEPEKRGEQYVS